MITNGGIIQSFVNAAGTGILKSYTFQQVQSRIIYERAMLRKGKGSVRVFTIY